MRLKIYGYSDDVVCVESDEGFSDETVPGTTITVGDEARGVRVMFKYAAGKFSGPVWRGAIEQISEGAPMFSVSVDLAEANSYPVALSYSVMFTITCPSETPIKFGKKVVHPSRTK